MFYLAGISISFFLALLLFSKRGKTAADKILALWLAFIGIHLFFFYLVISGNFYSYPSLLGVGIPFPLLHGPFLYLYAMAVTGRYRTLNRALLHFLVPALSYAYLLQFFLLPAEQKIYIYQHKGVGYETFIQLNTMAIYASGIVYVVLTTLLLRRHRRNILNEFSYTEKINLDWLQYLVIGIALIWVFVLLQRDDYVYGTAVVFVIFIGYFGIRQVGIFSPNNNNSTAVVEAVAIPVQAAQNEVVLPSVIQVSEEEQAQDVSENTDAGKKKYSKSGLSEEGANDLHERLKNIIVSEKIFTNSELTLAELAKRLNTHPNYLSQVINEREGKNFFDYINTLRTEEFIKMASDPINRKFTLLAMAYDCGFNSKSSFNKYFRKVTGISPTQYLQQLNVQDAA